ncbi:family 43 glycosylhydrolase [Mucilaginibacter daejeonensis]|uniref:family 43 glycosylhydrolase n=1 Tax=Mucilaginibacter daejeonensis TaxID=398049 RepID=UPI001D177CDD|nr:family 43 glycosylhydrolase [Mucilaginibacter daejeonensis]UEG52181.1 family 43 glycosylhydrolase [Mucilaginibacter daejeonensis]
MRNKVFTAFIAGVACMAVSCTKSNVVDDPTVAGPAAGNIQTLAAPALGTIIDSGVYRIRGVSSLPNGPVMEVTGNSTADGQQIQQWGWFPNNGQKWRVIKTDATYYKLVNLTSSKCLKSPSATSGDILLQGTDDGTDSQRWTITYTGSGNVFALTNKATGLKMVIDPETNTAGAKIRQKSTATGTQDRFEFHNLEFQNPVNNNSRPDPYVAQKDGYYYFLSTKGNRISITKTQDMSLLAVAPETTVWTPPSGTEYSANLWAPELYFLSGKWYIYFAAESSTVPDSHRMYVLENANSDPTTGTWTFKGKITDTTDQWAIDGTVLTIGTSNYFVWSGWDSNASKYKQYLYIAPMTNPWTVSGARVRISSPTNNWERYEPSGSLGAGVNEGPIALQKDASSPVFIIYSGSRYGSDNYCLAQIQLSTGADPMVAANWINKKQVFVKSDAAQVYGPGHNGFFTSSYTDPNGVSRTENWFIYHARTVASTPNGGRPPRMQKLTWNSDGSPNFGTPASSSTKLGVPIGE